MQIVFIDESGYTNDWLTGIEQQPFYALSAVCLPSNHISSTYDWVREQIGRLNLLDLSLPLGRGFEIKAKEIASGSGWWQTHNSERNVVRETMLMAPRENYGSAFVVVVDKAAHRDRYVDPHDPYLLAFQFIFERLSHYLIDANDVAYCIYDQNTRLQEGVLNQTSQLLEQGSVITGFSVFYDQSFSFRLPMERIIELALGDSKYSLGLQIADYYATFAYTYFRDGRPTHCGWWRTLKEGLHRRHGILAGIGLKIFPD